MLWQRLGRRLEFARDSHNLHAYSCKMNVYAPHESMTHGHGDGGIYLLYTSFVGGKMAQNDNPNDGKNVVF